MTPLRLLATALWVSFWPALLLVLGGDWHWRAGWIFGAWFLCVCASTMLWLLRKDPALLAERFRRPGTGGQSQRDQATVYVIMICFLAWFALMPLDGHRFHWSPRLPFAVTVAGGVLLAPAWLFMFRSFVDNTFASGLVRIQSERQHHVVSTGVYGFVRHPMYLGAVLMFVGGPLLLGSIAALVAGAALVAVLAARIVAEEELLVRDLPGYDDYRRRIRYRLIPFVW